jgi:hypothetical protein
LEICSKALLASQYWDFGGLPMYLIVEMIGPFESAAEMFPAVTADEFNRHLGWQNGAG